MKISLILPYWDRQPAADRAFALLAKHYAGMNLEVVVVDDGNAVPFVVPPVGLDVKVLRLEAKDEPKSPVTAWNAGVRAASGDIIALSCIEVLHESPVLPALAEELAALGEKGYVLASAWCPEESRWHCHSSVAVPDCPKGAGLSFLALLHRSLYEAAGGFDEEYREGAGYEDRDFIKRLLTAGATFKICDEYPVTHPKGGAQIRWPAAKFERNRAMFYQKWSKHVFVCVKAGTAFGPEYVNILRDMVMRNLPDGTPGRFVCLTEDASGLDAGIEVMPLPADLERWWGKLYLFKRGLFPDGARMVFMDLDTVVVGSLGAILSYDGEFATLKDFYHPHRVGPAVMLWRAGGVASVIWDDWEDAGKPRNAMGDLWWINKFRGGAFAAEADKLQDLHPDMFVSFKAHCHPYPPKGAKVVCFHGQPRPHNCGEKWVDDVWRIGGGGLSNLEIISNTFAEKVRSNVEHALSLPVEHLDIKDVHGGSAVIVGGGPSLKKYIEEIRARSRAGQTIVALNGSAKFLAEHGIGVDWHVLLDARAENVAFVKPPVSGTYFVASQCDRTMFDELTRERVVLYHPNTSGVMEALGTRMAHLISGGSTVGLVAMAICHTQGFRLFHLFGFDSSYEEEHHAYPQPMNDQDKVMDVVAAGRSFKCAPWMLAQVNQFQELAVLLAEDGCEIHVHGDGLLPHVAQEMTRAQQPEQEAA